MNCWAAPILIVELAGVTASDCKVRVTVNMVDPVMFPDCAVMVVTLSATPVAVPALEIVAALKFDERHVTVGAVKSSTKPSS